MTAITYAVKYYAFQSSYPPEELDTTDGMIGAGPYGTLAYFSPWGNVVMYYSPCGEYPGLYLLGEPISGEDTIEKMSGSQHKIH